MIAFADSRLFCNKHPSGLFIPELTAAVCEEVVLHRLEAAGLDAMPASLDDTYAGFRYCIDYVNQEGIDIEWPDSW